MLLLLTPGMFMSEMAPLLTPGMFMSEMARPLLTPGMFMSEIAPRAELKELMKMRGTTIMLI